MWGVGALWAAQIAVARAEDTRTGGQHGWWGYDDLGRPVPRPIPEDPEAPEAPLPLVLGPNTNGIDLRQAFSAGDQPLAAAGYLDVTKPPFSADATGRTDATAALQAAVLAARKAYLVVLLPVGSTFLVSKTIAVVQPGKHFMSTVGAPDCNNMPEIFGKAPKEVAHCARTAPVTILGQPAGANSAPPKLRVAANTGFVGPVVYLHNPQNENVNMNRAWHLTLVPLCAFCFS